MDSKYKFSHSNKITGTASRVSRNLPQKFCHTCDLGAPHQSDDISV